MISSNRAFDDFVDDCFVEKDPISNINSERSLELIASQLISEVIEETKDSIAS